MACFLQEISRARIERMKNELVIHPFEPVCKPDAKILILGSLPSVKSREQMFYYGHPQNRFWKVLAGCLHESVPDTIEQKKHFLIENQLAVWDVIAQCEISGSSDSSIRNARANDIVSLVSNTEIRMVICNGQKAGQLYKKYEANRVNLPYIILPSTSPANAAWNLEKLISAWRPVLLEHLGPQKAGACSKH